MSALDVLRCDLPQQDYLVWKWQPSANDTLRQNQIRHGSSLRVRTGEVAAFFYSTGGGQSPVDYIAGPADLILETKNLPFLANVVGLGYGGNSPFQAELYFINLGKATQFKWGVPSFSAFDPQFEYLQVPVSAYGSVTFQISDVKRFVEVQRLENLDASTLRDQVVPQLQTIIKQNIANLAAGRGIPLVQIEARLEDLSIALRPSVEKLLEGFGASLRNFAIQGVELEKESDGYKLLMRATRDQKFANIDAQGENQRKTLEIQRVELQRRQSLQTQSDFLAAHQANLQADVAFRAAESLGEVGSRSGGGGGGSNDLAATAISLGLGSSVGAAMGQQIAGNIQKTAAPTSLILCVRCKTPLVAGANFCPGCGLSLNQPNPGAPPPADPLTGPPPLPKVLLHIAQNNQVLGIFELAEVNQQLATGKLKGDDLGWHQGLKTWQPLKDISGVIVPTAPPPH